jgi:hypothetical protein
MARVLSLTLSIIGFVFLAFFITGYVIGENYKGEEKFTVNYSQRDVWSLLTDLRNFENTRNNIENFEVLAKYKGLYAWKEEYFNGDIKNYRHAYIEKNKTVIIEMTESNYGVTGVWRFDIRSGSTSDSTTITITEDSVNTSVLGRGIRFYFGQNKETQDWIKFIKTGLFGRLLTTP